MICGQKVDSGGIEPRVALKGPLGWATSEAVGRILASRSCFEVLKFFTLIVDKVARGVVVTVAPACPCLQLCRS